MEQQFINFYKEHGHYHLPEHSLISQDKDLLYTIAGIIPFKPMFEGHQQPTHKRVVTSQKCIRTNDIDLVGKSKRHLTGFTMLGHFSFGDYFKQESICLGYKLVTKIYGINSDNLIITVHPDDQETQEIWSKYLPQERIVLTYENIWSSEQPGILGQCTEFFYDFEPHKKLDNIDLDSDRFLEFYNIVFVDSQVDINGNIAPTPIRCIDSGLGLERLTYVLSKKKSIYEIDCFCQTFDNPILKDHYRTCSWIMSEGITPSNYKHGYILRKLMRRMFHLGYKPNDNLIFIEEYEKYQKVLSLGKQKLSKIANPSESDLLNLYQTFGIPIEISQQIINNKKII
ncbi:alanine--tRNA ligase-related protein [Nostoc sp. MG11]|uniref:alanine--tRNA ligase-related protein n=1 Tax=Nostoc sp. MG11 TaxID=2721166 RepID=UPI0029FF0215|nr:alanine--tRNA ligase-related protein [Nostoc sp. MG11]